MGGRCCFALASARPHSQEEQIYSQTAGAEDRKDEQGEISSKGNFRSVEKQKEKVMSLNYTEVRHQLESVKAQIDNLLEYMELNQSQPDRKLIDLEVYLRLADI